MRLTYLFLPAIGRGLGVSLAGVSVLVSVRSLTGMSSPFFGALTDRIGGRQVMSLGLMLLVIGAAITAAFPWFAAALVGFGILGLSKTSYDPAMQTYLGQTVPYERRGRAMGLAELSWSASWLAMPFCGWLISRSGWWAPFGLIAVLGVVAWWLTRRVLPSPAREEQGSGLPKGRTISISVLLRNAHHIGRDYQIRLALLFSFFLILAQDSMFVVYGAWMEDTFDLSVTALGLVTLVIGVAEVAAELGVAAVSDRVGKRRAVLISTGLAGSSYLLLPRLTGSLPVALAGTALLVLAFEFSIVGFFPIVSGLSRSARGTLMSFNVAALSFGRMLAAPLGVAMYRPGDLARNGITSASICLLSITALWLLRERGH